ncbi:MAG: retropepsin-like domain-containing protein [Bacilli bacterium]|nr:retropepsin-like domain-containing protein [Bacilli bacterium]
MKLEPISFTMSVDRKVGVLKTPIGIYTTEGFNKSFKGVKKHYIALWDTGSTMTVISEELAKEMNLEPVGEMVAETAGGRYVAKKYIISLHLPNRLNIENVMISSGKLGPGIDILIGMDIITLGDFAITNYNNKTVFSFRFPSSEVIDFVKEKVNN